MKVKIYGYATLACSALLACAPRQVAPPFVPAREYADYLRNRTTQETPQARLAKKPNAQIRSDEKQESRASLKFASDTENDTSESSAQTAPAEEFDASGGAPIGDADVYRYESRTPNIRDYTGPLNLGEPGVTASLWRESGANNNLLHDYRAWQPMDLITIVISETSEGKKEADTSVTSESTLALAIDKLLGYETEVVGKNPNIDPSALVDATVASDFSGEGETTRKGSLKAKISGMVAEVLPGGILRVEGQKIISVNNEEQVMILSGLVRPRDINSNNEVDSSKIANMRIDYFGRGTVGEVQSAGWLSRILLRLWPF